MLKRQLRIENHQTRSKNMRHLGLGHTAELGKLRHSIRATDLMSPVTGPPALGGCRNGPDISTGSNINYPLVMTNITMENHHLLWENPL